jgi:hypothetical protein
MVGGVVLMMVALPGEASASTEETRTTFELAHPIALDDVVAALDAAAIQPVAFRHTGSTEGGYQLGPGESLASGAARYQRVYERHEGGVPQISAVTVPGASLTAAELGALAPDVEHRYEMSSPTAEQPMPASDAATSAGSSADWAPLYGGLFTTDIGGDLPRQFQQSLLWENQDSIYAFGADAYEHDLKLFNRDNPGFLEHPACFGWQDNFWAQREGVYWSTTFPAETSPYFDDYDQSDSCETQDFTVGMLYPQFLQPQVQYSVTIDAKAGEEDRSSYALNAQKLSIICDSAACVNLPGPLGHPGEGQVLIGETVGSAPECRNWHKGENSVAC